MLRNYLKVILRNIRERKIYSLISITSLTIGLSCSMMILLFIRYEFSFDKFHEDASHIFRVLREQQGEGTLWNSSEHPLAAALKKDFPEVVKATRVKKNDEVGVVESGTQSFYEEGIYFADQDFLDIFSFPLRSGERSTALKEPFSVLLTQEMAEKYFGDENPMGKTIKIKEWYSQKKYDYKVSGVLKNIPKNSHFTFDFLISYNTLYSLKKGGKNSVETWSYFEPKTYIKLNTQADPRGLEEKFPAFLKRYKGESAKSEIMHLQPLTDIHLGGNVKFELETNSDMRIIYMFSAIAFFILIIACLNYINLSVAQSSKRAVEVGMRKVVGAGKSQLIRQFLGESLIFSVFAFLISLVVIDLVLPIFNSLMERDLTLDLLNNLDLLFIFLGITFFMGLLSGSYPAFLVSSFQPAQIIKGNLKIGSKKSAVFRNSLVVVQFAISIILLIGTFVIHEQLHYIHNKNLGFDKEQIITVYTMDQNLKRNPESFKMELLKNPDILGVSASLDLPTTIRRSLSIEWIEQGRKRDSEMNFTFVDYDYFDVYDIKIEKGRTFSAEFPTDQKQAVVLNRTAAKDLGWDDPIGRKLLVQGREWTIIGVVDDFHYQSLHWKIDPLVFIFYKGRGMDYFSIKISPDNIPGTLDAIEEQWKKFSPEFPFQFTFLDERIDRIYRAEERLGTSFNIFSFLTLAVACMGLFGLTSFLLEQKRKEISIRKILGADSKRIIFLLSKEYMKCLIIAVVVAWPIGYLVMNKWLQNFVYRTSIGIENFVLSGLLAFIFAFLTVSYHSMKAVANDPVDSLRYE
jgi:putative ABC transport system permease protein